MDRWFPALLSANPARAATARIARMRVSDDQRTQRAARWLVRQHLARQASQPIPAALAPRDLAQAYAIQDVFVALKAAQCGPVVGHKIALTSPQMRAMVGLDSPIAGRMHARQVVGGIARVQASDYGRLLVEFEVGFRMGYIIRLERCPLIW